MRTQGPWLATVLPVLNEEAHIEACLRSLLDQSLPSDEHMVMVFDGGSSDKTREIIHSIQENLDNEKDPLLQLYDNPERFVPHARNLALKHLPESVTHVLEFNGHIEIDSNHLEQLKSAWNRLESAHPNIGGLGCRVIGNEKKQGKIESILDATLKSPFGGSNGQFAMFDEEGPTNVPAFALHLRSALEAVNGWDESFLTSQDSDLSMRMLNSGYKLFRTPETLVKMRRRSSFRSWFLMSHRYGFWRTKVLLKHPQRLVLREFLPLIGLLATTLFLMISVNLALIPIIAYGGVLLLSGLAHYKKGISHAVGVPFSLFLLHTGFTLGLIDGCVRKGRASRDRS